MVCFQLTAMGCGAAIQWDFQAECKDPVTVWFDTEEQFHNQFILGKKLGWGASSQVRMAFKRPRQVNSPQQDRSAKQDLAVKTGRLIAIWQILLRVFHSEINILSHKWAPQAIYPSRHHI